MNSDEDNNSLPMNGSGDGRGKSSEYDYTFNGDVDIFSSLFDSNGPDPKDPDSPSAVDAYSKESKRDDEDEDDDLFDFDTAKRPAGRRTARKKDEKKATTGGSRSCSSSPTRQSLKRRKSSVAEPEKKRRKTSKELKEQDVVMIDDEEEEDNNKTKQRKTTRKRTTKNTTTTGKRKSKKESNVINLDSDSSDSEISEYEDVGEDDVYSRETDSESDEGKKKKKKNGRGGDDTEEEDQNKEATTFKSVQDSLKDIENLTKRLRSEDDDFFEDDYKNLLNMETFGEESQRSESRNAKKPIYLNVNMIGKSDPFKFKILRSDPFSKVLNFLSKIVIIPADKLLLKWGAITLDSNENSIKYALEDYEELSLVIEDEERHDTSAGGNDAGTEPLCDPSLSSLGSDIAGVDVPPASTEDDGAKVILKLSSPSAGNFSVRISLAKTVQALIAGASQHYKVPEEKVELQFDGERMNPATVLTDIGLEDEDQIDVVFHK